MDALRQAAARFRTWYAQAGRALQIGVAVGALVVICICCTASISALSKGGASSSPTTGIVAHQATATATKAPKPSATPVSGVTTATLGGPEKAFIARYGAYGPLINTTTDIRDHRATIQGQDTTFSVTLASNDDNTRVRFIRVTPAGNAATWSNSQAEDIAKTFLPSDAVYVKDMNVADFGIEHIYTSALLAQSFPADAFQDENSNVVAPGTFYLACGDQVDGQGKCSMQIGE